MLEQIIKILENRDPIGLIKAGAPAHEYSIEAKYILHIINNLNDNLAAIITLKEIQIIVYTTFICLFNPIEAINSKMAGNFEDYEDVAKDIWEIVNFNNLCI